jgi:hypothetical protein
MIIYSLKMMHSYSSLTLRKEQLRLSENREGEKLWTKQARRKRRVETGAQWGST